MGVRGFDAYISLYLMIESLSTSCFYVFAMKCPSFPICNLMLKCKGLRRHKTPECMLQNHSFFKVKATAC